MVLASAVGLLFNYLLNCKFSFPFGSDDDVTLQFAVIVDSTK